MIARLSTTSVMRIETTRSELSFCRWYPLLSKNSLEARIVPIPERVREYLEHDAFVLPAEATRQERVPSSRDAEWSDGTACVLDDEPEEEQPSFPEFSQRIQRAIDDYGAVFVKSNWSSAADATWVTATKSLKCTSLEDVYLLLKSSDRISQDLSAVTGDSDQENSLGPCLALKRWRDIDPCTEFRCYVVDKQLVGIGQRDVSQYYKHIENEKYDIPRDIKSLYMERIKDKFPSDNYSFDVIRYKKDKVKIVDFGPLDETTTTKGTLFTLQELHSQMEETPEFRFIFQDMGIQPKATRHFCVPREINEFFQASGGLSAMDRIRQEVEEQEQEERGQAEADS